MSTKSFFTVILLCHLISTTEAQITLSQQYDTYVELIYVDINEPKILARSQDTVQVFNLDHTLFSSFILPIPVAALDSGGYQLSLVSRTLFDCDSTNLEYLISRVGQDSNDYVRVYRDDGTQLLNLPYYTFGYRIQGSFSDWRVADDPSGARLRFRSSTAPFNSRFRIYQVCGRLPRACCTSELIPMNIPQEKKSQGQLHVFPNPSDGLVQVNYQLPNGTSSARFECMNMEGQVLKTGQLGSLMKNFAIDVSAFANGQYIVNIVDDKGTKLSARVIKVEN